MLTDAQKLADVPVALAAGDKFEALSFARTENRADSRRRLSRGSQIILIAQRRVEIRRHHLHSTMCANVDGARVRHNGARCSKCACCPRQMNRNGIAMSDSNAAGFPQNPSLRRRERDAEIRCVPGERQNLRVCTQEHWIEFVEIPVCVAALPGLGGSCGGRPRVAEDFSGSRESSTRSSESPSAPEHSGTSRPAPTPALRARSARRTTALSQVDPSSNSRRYRISRSRLSALTRDELRAPPTLVVAS